MGQLVYRYTLAGSDGGPVFKCLMHHTPAMMAEFSAKLAGGEVRRCTG
jgi:hypothetical protein